MGEFHGNRPYFFKLIFKGHNTEHLQIPPKFVKHLPKELPDQAILRDSSGDEWRVKLCKTAEGIYLQDGWKQYFEDHSLGDNEFLLFKYNGEKLCFDVIIFGKDGCERVYGSVIRTNHETASSSGRPRKTSLRSHLLHQSKKPCKDSPERSMVWKMAESFTSDFPYFKTCMSKCNVGMGPVLLVPALFAREHFPQCTTKVVLRNSEDQSWEVKYATHGNNHKLSQGWRVFVHDNKLKIGDICIFELLAKKEILVHVFRAPKIELTCNRV